MSTADLYSLPFKFLLQADYTPDSTLSWRSSYCANFVSSHWILPPSQWTLFLQWWAVALLLGALVTHVLRLLPIVCCELYDSRRSRDCCQLYDSWGHVRVRILLNPAKQSSCHELVLCDRPSAVTPSCNPDLQPAHRSQLMVPWHYD